MADLVFNIAKGAIAEKIRDGANLGVLLLKAKEADATLVDRATVTALLAAAGNTEADFTNYVRKTISNASCAVNVDNVNDRTDTSCGTSLTYTAAGGATNNSNLKAVIYEDTGSDATRVPLVALDAAFTTDGTDVQLSFNAAGFARAN
jgi:hypothetical protein